MKAVKINKTFLIFFYEQVISRVYFLKTIYKKLTVKCYNNTKALDGNTCSQDGANLNSDFKKLSDRLLIKRLKLDIN